MARVWKSALMLLLPAYCWAESAVLECTQDRRLSDGTHLFRFRVPLVEGWKISKASLLLHPADAERLSKLSVSTISERWAEGRPGVKLGRTSVVLPGNYGGGWVRLDLDPRLIGPWGLAVRSVDGGQLHLPGCQSVQHSPYLLIEGESPARRHSR